MSQEFALVISNPNNGQFLDNITWNFEECKSYVQEIISQYENVVYSNDTIKLAKEDRARLNSLKKAISDRRIQVKKQILAPYEKFEKEVNEITDLILQPIEIIDSKIKEYEETVKLEKFEKIQDYYIDQAEDILSFVPFKKIFDKKWLNASASFKSIKTEIDNKILSIRNDYKIIQGVDSEFIFSAIDVYKRTLCLSEAMEELQRLEKLQETTKKESLKSEEVMLDENAHVSNLSDTEKDFQNELEAQFPREITAERSCVSQNTSIDISSETDIKENVYLPMDNEVEDNQIYRAIFAIYGTASQLTRLKEYIRENGLKVENL